MSLIKLNLADHNADLLYPPFSSARLVIFLSLMDHPESLHLLSRLAADDQQAMKEVFEAYYPLVYHNIFRVIRQKELSEDLTQDVFVRFWRKRSDLTINQSLGGYLTTMAYHEAVGHLRKKSSQMSSPREVIGDELQIDGHLEVESRDLQDHVDQAIQQLPPRCRGVFLLSRYEGKSYKEIGEMMQISIKTVENQMSKALNVLRASLKDVITTLMLLILGNL
ncbi:MAG: RNA polymerase sigma-70 factor [Saprospiraceae bacterium]|nr:RNA polymerase sigma-70 factor [Saprospiraceae bacterium]